MNSNLPDGATKYDADKPKMELLPLIALYEVAKVLTFGAKKYAPWGWQSVPQGKERYTAALLRHLTLIQEGEEYDEESGLLHISHVACNALFLVWFKLREMNLTKETNEQ